VEEEFGEIQIDSKERFLCATTEPIMLQGLYLGSFAIHFFWDRWRHHPDVQCFDILALDPHPAAADSRVTHPHVKSKTLCAGDAKLALSKALEQGRLADAFCLIHGVLANYNVNSPHVRVDEWGGTRCHACDCGSMDEDDCRLCEPCGHDYCPDCWSNCGVCGDVRCLDCMKCCAVCYERCCGRCLHGSVHSGRECCRDCLRTCAACGALVAKDEVSPATDRCPGCRVPESSCGRGDQPSSPGQGPLAAPEIHSLEHEHA
jgi:hypothetical protein